MIIQNINGVVSLYAEGNNKITNAERSFFTDMIYLGKNDSVENYQEVPYEVWGHFVEDEIPKNKVEELTAKIKTLEEEKAELKDKLLEVEKEHGDYLLDNDLRITMLELGLA